MEIVSTDTDEDTESGADTQNEELTPRKSSTIYNEYFIKISSYLLIVLNIFALLISFIFIYLKLFHTTFNIDTSIRNFLSALQINQQFDQTLKLTLITFILLLTTFATIYAHTTDQNFTNNTWYFFLVGGSSMITLCSCFYFIQISNDEVFKKMTKSFKYYSTDKEIANKWDQLHIGLQCCGLNGFHDFSKNCTISNCENLDILKNVPNSCDFEFSNNEINMKRKKHHDTILKSILVLISITIVATAVIFVHFKSQMNTDQRITEEFLQMIFYGRISQKQTILVIGGLAILTTIITSASLIIKRVPKSLWCLGTILFPVIILMISAFVYYVYQYEFGSSELQEEMIKSFKTRKHNGAVSGKWKSLESDLECCGVFGPNDYFKGAEKQNRSKLENFISVIKKGAKIANAAMTVNLAQLYDELKEYTNVPTTCYSKKMFSTIGSNGCLDALKQRVKAHNKTWMQYYVIILCLSIVLIILSLFTFKS